ncbi:MAG: hypothetical protein HZA22_03265 [Nitrospirae bacterium]|nr:hypothetical protein [Nitrospirota bacterium]MBI5695768.1 hypothetical protein [Nitrospirota bacterium]
MKTLMMSLMAAAFVLVAASFSGAEMMWKDYSGATTQEYHALEAIDSAGIAVITITPPSGPIVSVASEELVFDSNGVFTATVLKAAPHDASASAGKGMMEEKGTLYCFGSLNRQCAEAY